MKARMSYKTALMNLPPHLREACDAYLAEVWARRKKIIVRRYIYSMCLALNDLYHFGNKRLKYVVTAIEDITAAYAEDSYAPKDTRNDAALKSGEDRMAQLLEDEIIARRINIERMKVEED